MITITSPASPIAMQYNIDEHAWIEVSKEGLGAPAASTRGIDLIPGRLNCPIGIMNLSYLLSGLEDAYDKVCNAAFEQAGEGAAKKLTSYELQVEHGRRVPGLDSVSQGDTLPLPLLRNEGLGKCMLYDGNKWGTVPFDRDMIPYFKTGNCFGWDIMACVGMNTEEVDNSHKLAKVVGNLLSVLAHINTDQRLYTYGLKYETFSGYGFN